MLDSVLSDCGIPKLYLDADMDVKDADASGYFITGKTGVGKTYMAVSILRKWIVSRRAARIVGDTWSASRGEYVPRYETSAAFISVPDLIGQIQDSFGEKSAKVLQKYINVAGLVIDDLGSESDTDWRREVIYRLISRRVNDCKPTIVTSNLSLAQIDDWEPRIASRLGAMKVVELVGKDRRILKGAGA